MLEFITLVRNAFTITSTCSLAAALVFFVDVAKALSDLQSFNAFAAVMKVRLHTMEQCTQDS
jgi:hypothetical protein